MDRHDTLNVQARALHATDGTAELYLTATPDPRLPLDAQLRETYAALLEHLREQGMAVFCERFFATAKAMDAVLAHRRGLPGVPDDGVAPVALAVGPGSYGGFAGVQIHAVRADLRPRPLGRGDGGAPAEGRVIRQGDHTWVHLAGLSADPDLEEAEQAGQVFSRAASLLRQVGADMRSVARTWLWLKDLCGWYDELNAVRNVFFRCEGLIDEEARSVRLPASTGIGMYGAGGAAITLDLIAMPGREGEIRLVEAGGSQESAFEYGSAFSRAAVAPMPGGPTVFISGTAAIDRSGATEHVGRIEAQIDGTIAHVRSLLAQFGCDDGSVLTALAYCKTPEVEEVFRERWADLPWPRITMNGDVCRPELLFEVEVTAAPAGVRPL
ncbi:MAG: hypothetical protein C0617_13280 [Desulfuromonas sp.]|uniref:hypothetical protein n=1 Tax=Desulfuromonas sp. TaxID=892 RepID=UPI000CB6BE1E|nr:hypothetical protein [Desulfuromonas sp.]PLX82838.1 MAG: hypothetical protein C0617_13280 [Desulfuromonas sp.]